MASSKLLTLSEPLTLVADPNLAHGAPKGPKEGTNGPCGFETPLFSPSALEGACSIGVVLGDGGPVCLLTLPQELAAQPPQLRAHPLGGVGEGGDHTG